MQHGSDEKLDVLQNKIKIAEIEKKFTMIILGFLPGLKVTFFSVE